jgi:tetratricopeptide (TPR) repeat protein
MMHNQLAWIIAASPNSNRYDAAEALRNGEKAVSLEPEVGAYWNTLGVANYRAGNWKAAMTALDKSIQLGDEAYAIDRLFLAMANKRLGQHNDAQSWYDQAAKWIDANAPDDKELIRFRREAEELLFGNPESPSKAEVAD